MVFNAPYLENGHGNPPIFGAFWQKLIFTLFYGKLLQNLFEGTFCVLKNDSTRACTRAVTNLFTLVAIMDSRWRSHRKISIKKEKQIGVRKVS